MSWHFVALEVCLNPDSYESFHRGSQQLPSFWDEPNACLFVMCNAQCAAIRSAYWSPLRPEVLSSKYTPLLLSWSRYDEVHGELWRLLPCPIIIHYPSCVLILLPWTSRWPYPCSECRCWLCTDRKTTKECNGHQREEHLVLFTKKRWIFTKFTI